MTYFQHVLLVAGVAAVTWLLVISSWPRLLLQVYKRALLVRGFGDGPIPINTLYTEPPDMFAQPLAPRPSSGSDLMTRGVNHDTLAIAGWLDLSRGPLTLHVPDMPDRYFSVQFTDPANNTSFAYVGSRTTGTRAGDYLITGPGWQGEMPNGFVRIASPNHSVLVLGRILVKNDGDLAAAHGLARQIQLDQR